VGEPGQGAAGAYGEHLADRFWLERPVAYVTRSLSRGPLAVTQIRSDFPTPEPSRSIGYDEAYLIGLMVADVPDHQLWQDGRAVRTEAFQGGNTALYDLRRDPVSFTRTAHHSLHFYMPRGTLRELAERAGARFDGELRFRFAVAGDDPVIRMLGAALLPALERGGALSGLFLDHILYAAAVHVLDRYGELGPLYSTGGLTPAQVRRATGMMDAALGRGRFPRSACRGVRPVRPPLRPRLPPIDRRRAVPLADPPAHRTGNRTARPGASADRRYRGRLRLRQPEPFHARLQPRNGRIAGAMAGDAGVIGSSPDSGWGAPTRPCRRPWSFAAVGPLSPADRAAV